MSRDAVLRGALGANAVYSFVCAVALTTDPQALAGALGVPSGPALPIVGLLLMGWAGFVGWQARRSRISTPLALLTVLADAGWVLATLAGLALWGHVLAPGGGWLVAGVGAGVGALAVAQLVGIRRVHAETHPGLATSWRHCVPVEVDVPAATVWRVIADLGDIDRFLPDVDRSEADGPAAPGTTRICTDTAGRTWRETCTAVEEGRALTLRFHAEDEDFPFPVEAMTGGWVVEPASSGCRVEAWWSFDPRFAWAAVFLVPLLSAVLDRKVAGVVERMAAEAGGEAPREDHVPVRLAAAC